MTLADISKEEVDPLLTQIKKLMIDNQKNLKKHNVHSNHDITYEEDDHLFANQTLEESPNLTDYNMIDEGINITEDNNQHYAKLQNHVHHDSTSNFVTQKKIDSQVRSCSDKDSGEIGSQSVNMLMHDILKPILKKWLDEHLPILVENLVREQIEKLMQQFDKINQTNKG